jgi:hypothetical protein
MVKEYKTKQDSKLMLAQQALAKVRQANYAGRAVMSGAASPKILLDDTRERTESNKGSF